MPKISSTVPPNLIPAGRSVLRTVIHDAAYIAPEIYIACQLIESGSSNIYVDFEQVDIFAFSIILYEIATRLPPFDDMNSMRIGYQV